MSATRSQELFARACNVIPGGVNSPVRACRNVHCDPLFIASAQGAHLLTADGRNMIDFVGSWGPMLLGHAYPEVTLAVREAALRGTSYGAPCEDEVRLAEEVCAALPSVEMVRMVNSGTEAVMSAIRLARGYTGRNKIIKFTGCYHGHSDGLLVKAGSGAMTSGIPDSMGVPVGCTQDTLSADYNSLDSVKEHFAREGEQIAAVIIEPVAANMGVVLPEPGFLQGLRSLCTEYGALLIFDEVITGFRLCAGGAQEAFGVLPDLSVFGKIIGAGMPVGAYGGKRCIMETVSPLGPVYQAGTLSGNPVAMSAGYAMLAMLRDNPQIYEKLNAAGNYFFGELGDLLQKAGLPYQVTHFGSLGCLFFTGEKVTDYERAKTSDTDAYAAYFQHMLSRGIYLAPAQFEAMFLSTAHTKEMLDETLEAAGEYLLRFIP